MYPQTPRTMGLSRLYGTHPNTPWATALPAPEDYVRPGEFSALLLQPRVRARVQQSRIAMSLNARGMRNRARVLRINTNMGRSERRKTTALASVNTALLRILHPEELLVH